MKSKFITIIFVIKSFQHRIQATPLLPPAPFSLCIMPDFGAQAGQSYAKHAARESHSESGPMSKDAHLDEILKQIKAGPLSSLAEFLYFLFGIPKKKITAGPPSHSSTVSYFFGGHGTLTAADITELMCLNSDGIPKRRNVCASKHRMAHLQLGEWAVNKVEGCLSREATQIWYHRRISLRLK
jgi:hypothetical protein